MNTTERPKHRRNVQPDSAPLWVPINPPYTPKHKRAVVHNYNPATYKPRHRKH